MPLLELDKVTCEFGGLRAVSEVSLHLETGELVGLIGPNGAGKTTVFNLLTGVYAPSEGRILFDGASLVGWAPWRINRAGIARTFQNIRLFSDMTVLDNVKIAYHNHVRHGVMSSILRLPTYFRGEQEIEDKALAFLSLFHLEEKKDELARNLPYGEQRRLEIARALATEPRLLLLDEPAAGMNPRKPGN
ncbi:leucine/isoleucine/valine transporter subunit; ATP-binding component of ABC superfamily (fragment) [Kyrpidia spormannii]|uniref:Leucine/isoleucine/valine transporter subunit ATP-binding component of ABC superfamily n=1 Tax=Kyrpidia spormannii TaxID=2055160 RepID=A0ACA8Z9E8_9BACL